MHVKYILTKELFYLPCHLANGKKGAYRNESCRAYKHKRQILIGQERDHPLGNLHCNETVVLRE